MEAEFYNGRRLSYEGDLCTVRYIGPVNGTNGLWIGVEWDNVSRGKHSGLHNGIRYFDCISRHPTSGSFIRLNRPHEPARSFIEAVHRKYVSESTRKNHDQISRGKAEKAVQISGKEVKEVGFDKIRKQMADLQSLRIVLVDGFCINRPKARGQDGSSTVESENDIELSCPGIIDLDLSRNMFEEYGEIIDICRQLSHLQHLKINGNRFRSLSHVSSNLTFPTLKSLSLDETYLNWTEIMAVTGFFSNIVSLSASGNGLSYISTEAFPTFCTSLALENNEFRCLHDLRAISKASSLSSLKLRSNRISHVCSTENQRTNHSSALVFPRTIHHVDLSSNRIESWEFIDELGACFPGMVSLRISQNPLYHDQKDSSGKSLSADDGYMLTLARLGRLTSLNFSQIAPKERFNADTYYLSQIANELSSAPEEAAAGLLSRHRRYNELCVQYGTPSVRRTSASIINPNTLEARLVLLSVKVDALALEASSTDMPSSLEIEVPKMLSIYSVLGILGRKLNLRPLELELLWETGEWDLVQDEIDQNSYYEDAEDIKSFKAQGKGRQIQREELLVPRTRPIGSWIDTNKATLRVRWSEIDRKRSERAQINAQAISKAL